MSRTAIVTPKICACTLVSMMIVPIVRDVLQGRACGEYNGPRFFGVQQGDPIEFGELVASRALNLEEGSRRNHTHWLGTEAVLPTSPRQGEIS